MKPFALLLPLVALIASCAPLTPEARIAASPDAYNALGTRHQSLVRQGQIDTGMPASAVRLAWGEPSREYVGSDAGKPTQVWEYHRSKPVYSTNYYGYYSFGPYRRRGYAFDVGPEITYIPYRMGTVWFRSGRVVKWERVR
jgi:hypothetical protein